MSSKAIFLEQAPVPRGAYPHMKRAGDFLYISGTSARNSDNSIDGASTDEFGVTELDISAQTRSVISKIQTMLKTEGFNLSDLVEITVFLTNMNDFKGYNEVYSEYFDHDGPVRTTVAVHQLPHPQLLIEIKAVAYKAGGA